MNEHDALMHEIETIESDWANAHIGCTLGNSDAPRRMGKSDVVTGWRKRWRTIEFVTAGNEIVSRRIPRSLIGRISLEPYQPAA